MRSPSRLFVFVSMLSVVGGALVMACSGDADDPPESSPESDASSSAPDARTPPVQEPDAGDATDAGGDAGGDGDDAGDAGDECSYEPPALDAGGPCGTMEFGAPAAAFGPVDEGAGDYSGTTLAPGIYDAISAERASGSNGSWRETFVVEGDRFTRIRQIDTGSGGGPGPVTYRSGTFEYQGQRIKLTYDCAQSGDSAVDAGADDLPSDAVLTACDGRFRYGATGIRITLRRR